MLNFISAVNPMTILYSTLVLLVLALVFGVTLAVLGKNLPYTRTNASNKCVKSSRAQTAADADTQAATLLQRLS